MKILTNNTKKAFQINLKRFFSLLILISSFSCTNTNKVDEIKEVVKKEMTKEEFGSNVEILITKKGKANIKITAPKAVRNYAKKPYTEFPEGMKLEIFNETGESESKLTANYGKMGDKSDKMVAKDSVVVLNKNGETLSTEHLIWDKKKSVIKTEGFVKIHTKDEIIYGDGFESNDDFTEYTITNIHGIVNIKEEDI